MKLRYCSKRGYNRGVMKKINCLLACAAALILSLGGCEWIDNLGRHLPVAGERCEHWQCFTESGRMQSDAKKRELAGRDGQKRVPVNDADNPAAKPPATAPATPRAPTPFDMTPDQLGDLPPPVSPQ
jgi:hypothetical protein